MDAFVPFVYGQPISLEKHVRSVSEFFNSENPQRPLPLCDLKNAPYFMVRIARRDQSPMATSQLEESAEAVVSAVTESFSMMAVRAIPSSVDALIAISSIMKLPETCEGIAVHLTAAANPPLKFNELRSKYFDDDDRESCWYHGLFEEIGETQIRRTYGVSGTLPSKTFCEMSAFALKASEYVSGKSFGINYFGIPSVETSLNLVRTEPEDFLKEFFRLADQSGYKVKQIRREHSARWKHSLEQYRFSALGKEWLDVDVYVDLLALKYASLNSWIFQQMRQDPTVSF